MHFQICIKQVPDVTASVDTGRMILNAYDASAVEEALVLRDKYGGVIDLILVGPSSASETIRKALAMGADSATHVVCEDISNFDSAAFAHILADNLRDVDFDVVLCGKQAQDTDAGLTGGMLAELLGLPFATNAVGMDIEESSMVVTRQGDSGREVLALPTPCLVTCSNDMNDPRIPKLKGIMAAKKKTINTVDLANDPVPGVVFTGFADVPSRPAGVVFEGDVETSVDQLVEKLRNEAKVLS
ncbi:MAG: electron transfer flavoprotein subunit beta/FixA family protein [Rhodothermales bacterium]|nr:electron transfer flavoprotein subunit beta/FixA family protein [Rhodothermales bacterium]